MMARKIQCGPSDALVLEQALQVFPCGQKLLPKCLSYTFVLLRPASNTGRAALEANLRICHSSSFIDIGGKFVLTYETLPIQLDLSGREIIICSSMKNQEVEI